MWRDGGWTLILLVRRNMNGWNRLSGVLVREEVRGCVILDVDVDVDEDESVDESGRSSSISRPTSRGDTTPNSTKRGKMGNPTRLR
jgi:hypothetical protein